MRLLHTSSLHFADIDDGNPPPYAVLSHRWQDGELSHEDFLFDRRKDSPGYQKITGACKIAKLRGREYIWIDSICIDKKSSAELSEAINAMFGWYKAAAECYVLLSDVTWKASSDNHSDGSISIENSKWFSRGWTLQELLAPRQVLFYDSAWLFMGTKVALAPMLSLITGIDLEVLRHPERVFQVNIAQRMSWASRRVCTRPEDIAYCLLGLFNVNMALLYGEGAQKAFFRLQLEILKGSTDDSIFAWTDSKYSVSGMLAPWPSAFANSGDVRTSARPRQRYQRPWTWTNLGLELWIPGFADEKDHSRELTQATLEQRREPVHDTIFGRDVETFTLSCWKRRKPDEDMEQQSWRWRDRVIRIRLERHGAAWRRVNCKQFLLGVDKDDTIGSASGDVRREPLSYRLVYVAADAWEPQSGPLRLSATSQGQDAEFSASVDEAWEKCNLLSLDGSDFARSYWTLLALSKLVECIAEEEEDHAEPHYSSFHPEPYLNDDERSAQTSNGVNHNPNDNGHDESIKLSPANKRYLLCHYFDYIGGASFGGLIAIMLGRFHMAICDCINGIEDMGADVFQTTKPISIYARNQAKYDASKLQAFMEAMAKKSSWNMYRNGTLKFLSKPGTCRTFVTAIETDEHERSSRKVRVLRSYRDTISDRAPGVAYGSSTSQISLLVFDTLLESAVSSPLVGSTLNAAKLDIGLVARATTVSPGYFEPLTLKGSKYRVMFEHGGFGFPFNPTLFGVREIDTAAGVASAGTIVSVGTTVKGVESRNVFARSLEPERVHVAIESAARQDDLDYFRLDPDVEETAYAVHDLAPDEWEPPTSNNSKAGEKTKSGINAVFNRWLDNPDVQNYFTECAQSLVRRRRLRVHRRARWARHVAGTDFKCPLKHATQLHDDSTWSDADEFADHLRDKHKLEGKAVDETIERVMASYRGEVRAKEDFDELLLSERTVDGTKKMNVPEGVFELVSRGKR